MMRKSFMFAGAALLALTGCNKNSIPPNAIDGAIIYAQKINGEITCGSTKFKTRELDANKTIIEGAIKDGTSCYATDKNGKSLNPASFAAPTP